jgi:hypothetical protein
MRSLFLLAALTPALALSGGPTALARVINEVEPNDTIQTAQDIDSPFSWDIGFDPDIVDSELVPHITILGTGNGPEPGTFDYYKFTVSAAGVRGVFDIDYAKKPGEFDLDTEIFLYSFNGTYLAENDDSPITLGGSGSTDTADSFLEYIFSAPGAYVIGVGRWNSFDSGVVGQGIAGNGIIEGMTYRLQISIVGHEMSDLPPPLPGDANHDRSVNLADFNILKANFGKVPAVWEEGNFNDDDAVNLGDFNILKANFGRSGEAAVPEPSAVVLAFLGLAGWLAAAGHRRRTAGFQE